ncbi:MoaF-related domain-containing protein [Nonomuraea turcica]|uniref:MoaF-related domain-containing protein n=1 Tax=Nonomuraea sp. G32 TaxID=3067274 RepID=UPI00273BA7FC|nr:hypothetical protein [Nonomuraea sp. G32]MDP4510094.1 hypothetical protein [Nonomuraea sp. G32]
MSAPIPGEHYLVNLGDVAAALRYEPDARLTITVLEGGDLAETGHTETVSLTTVEARPGLFLMTWYHASGLVVTQLADFPNGMVRWVAVAPGQPPVLRAGTLRRVAGPSTR